MDADTRGWTEQYNAKTVQDTMLKGAGRAEEVAAAIPFLASDDVGGRLPDRRQSSSTPTWIVWNSR